MQNIINKTKAGNPYPEDIFIEPTKEEYMILQKLFKDAGLIQDKFFGAYGRKVWNNCINMIEQLIREKEVEMFHTKKQVNDIRNLHIGAGILIYRNSDREVIEEKILIIDHKMINAGSGKPIEFNIVEEEE